MEWTSSERELLRKLYPEHGPSWEGWAEVLPSHSINAIKIMATAVIGVKSKRRKGSWTKAEDAKIKKLYPEHGPSWEGWAEVLPSRSLNAIKIRACIHLHVHMKPKPRKLPKSTQYIWHWHWKTRDVSLLCAFYAHHGGSWQGWRYLLFKKTPKSINEKAHYLGLHCERYRKPTKEQQQKTEQLLYALADMFGLEPIDVAIAAFDEVVTKTKE